MNIWNNSWFIIIIISLLVISILINFLYGNFLTKKRNIKLKKLVNRRTSEIQHKNSILLKQKKELEELNQLHEKRRKRIENQTLSLKKNEEELEQLNQLLEKRQVRIENQALKLEKQRDELKKLNATKDKLFSIIAHDLKNPFNTILGFTELINTNIEEYDKTKIAEINKSLYDTATQIYKLLENLLNWSRAQIGTIKLIPEEIHIKNFFTDIRNLLLSSAQNKNIEIKLNVQDDLTVLADKNMLHTVLRNLVTNAIKFTDHGTVTLSAESIDGHVKITVIDTGVGMNEEVLKNLFEVNKGKSRMGTIGEQGTGLGLIICKEFILKHNGKIWATSQPDKGSCMFIMLPK